MSNEPESKPSAVTYGQQLLDFLKEKGPSLSPLGILTHDFPDPDALAAAYALAHLAKSSFDIETRIIYGGVVGRVENKEMVRILKIPIHKIKPGLLKKYPNIALVDTQPAFGNNTYPQNRRPAIILDQHQSAVPPEGDLVIIDPDCGATCVIVAQALLLQGSPIPARVATALAYGIITDTLDLYRANRPDVVQTYLQILNHADMRALARIQNPQRPLNFFSILGKGIRNATMYRRLMISHLGNVGTPDLVSQVADFLLACRRLQWCMVTGRCKGRLYASLRTNRTDAQAGEVLRDAFGNKRLAGGHRAIAGGSYRVGLNADEEVWIGKEKELAARLMKRLRISSKVEPRKPFNR